MTLSKNLIRLLLYFWQESYLFSSILFILIILLGIIPAAELWIIGDLINHISDAITNNQVFDLQGITVLLVILIGLMLLRNWFRILSDGIQDYLRQKVTRELQLEVSQKASEVELAFYEHQESYDQLQRANGGIQHQLTNVYLDGVFTLEAIVSIIAYILTLSTGHWSLGPTVMIAAIISIWLKTKRAKQKYAFDYHILTPIRKAVEYFSNLLTSKEYAKELRIFGSRDYLISKWHAKQKEHADKVYQDEKKDLKYTLINEGFTNLLILIACTLIAISIMDGDLSIGYFAILVQVVIRLMNEIENIVGLMRNNYQYALFTDNLFSFIDRPISSDIEPRQSLPEPLKGEIRFADVWFKYPSSDDWVIKGLSFKIEPNETIAIVGGNGAGKSTIIKLILGLYTPQKGNILIDDVPIELIDKDQLNKNMSAIFQDFTKFELTLRESIGIGDIENIADQELLDQVVRKSSVNEWIDQLDQGYDTYLSKTFGGRDLSGGQWQRVALARSLMRDSAIIILDEPTSALDPIAELNVFEEFKALSKDKTALLISHRMGSARIADKIIVIEDGEKIEEGVHEDLINNDRVYAKLFETQAKWYHSNEAGEKG